MATATQGSFVNRTKSIERDGSLQRIRVISGSVFEPTGSNLNTAFTVYGANYRLIARDGGEIKTGGGCFGIPNEMDGGLATQARRWAMRE